MNGAPGAQIPASLRMARNSVKASTQVPTAAEDTVLGLQSEELFSPSAKAAPAAQLATRLPSPTTCPTARSEPSSIWRFTSLAEHWHDAAAISIMLPSTSDV